MFVFYNASLALFFLAFNSESKITIAFKCLKNIKRNC